MRTLITSFTTFADHAVNPSRLIVEALAQRHPDVQTVVLPVEYGTAGEQLCALLRANLPDVVLMLGLAAGRTAINLERFALNVDDASLPDNAGETRSGQPIIADGPAAYTSTLPLDTLQHSLHARDIPVVISNHAGAYLCNHVFYVARHQIAQSGMDTWCGFIHVPPISESDDQPGLSLAKMIEAVECCLDVLADTRGL